MTVFNTTNVKDSDIAINLTYRRNKMSNLIALIIGGLVAFVAPIHSFLAVLAVVVATFFIFKLAITVGMNMYLMNRTTKLAKIMEDLD